jgi:uncharacterized protein YcbX
MAASISQLFLYPIKGCRGIEVERATLAATGLEVDGIGDREWVVVDADGEFLSQRELPKMALVETRLTSTALRLRAPGMLQLEVPFASEGDVVEVKVWNDQVPAVTQGEVADAWLSRYLDTPCRLMRFDPEARRLSNVRYTGATAAPYKFADAFALLVASTASLAELNRRLAGQGHAPVDMRRFRPNLVLDGLEAHDEDHIDLLEIDTPQGTVRLKFVKPCVRCTIPGVDPLTGEQGFAVIDALAGYRQDPRAGGAATFGMNAIVVEGLAHELAVGQPWRADLAF